MADLNDLKQTLQRIIEALPEVLPQVATSMSLTAKAVSERIIKDRGFGYTYSENEFPVWFLTGKELNGRGLNFIKTVQKEAETLDIDPTANWMQFRGAQGLQTAFVDLTYSGKMWAGMFPQAVKVDGTQYIAPLGNNTVEGQQKMNWNYERYNDFLGAALSGEGIDTVYDVGYAEFMRLLAPVIENG